MTTEDIANRIVRLLGDDGSRFPIPDVVIPEISAAQKQIAQETGCLYKTIDITGWTNSNTYAADNLIYRVEKVMNGTTEVKPEDFVDDTDQKYLQKGSTIYIDPAPDSTDTITLSVRYLPADITDISDTLEIPAQLYNALVYLVVTNLMMIDQNPFANTYMQRYMLEINGFKPAERVIFPWTD